MISNADKLKELNRELAMRRRLYPKWVADGSIEQAAANRRIEVMEAIAEDYEWLIATAKDQGSLPL